MRKADESLRGRARSAPAGFRRLRAATARLADMGVFAWTSDRSPRDLLPRLLVVVVCLVAFILSIQSMGESRRYAGLVSLTADARKAQSVSDEAVARWLPALLGLVEDGICRPDILTAAIRMSVLDMDRRDPAQDKAAWDAKLLAAESLLRHGLSCLPQNSEIWLRLALVRYLRFGFPEETAFLARMSQLQAPADAQGIRARYALYERLTGPAAELVSDIRARDLEVLCGPHGKRLRSRFSNACDSLAAQDARPNGVSNLQHQNGK